MQKTKQSVISLDGKAIVLETGLFGAQASGAIVARCGDTMVLAAVVRGPAAEGIDYFPLQVEYRERYYAGGVISSSRFVKREGRPSDNEILTSRLIDRSIRPLFPKGLHDEVQVIVTPLSIDGENEPEILGIIAASAAIRLSDIPWDGPVGSVRVGLDPEGKFVVNPTTAEKKTSRLDLVVSGAKGSIAMVEAGANEVTESEVLEALKFAQERIDTIVVGIEELAKTAAKTKSPTPEVIFDKTLVKLVQEKVDPDAILADSKTVGGEGIKVDPIVDKLLETNPDADRVQLVQLVDQALQERIRTMVLEEGIRFDGRKPTEIREIHAQVGLLPRTHGSGFFQRGLTHALSIATLGSPEDEQLIDGMKGEETKRYMHHYNMPGFATGEPGRVGAPNRREIGHGALAERALVPMLPSREDFPYTIRVVTEIMSGNGSTSQASVCGSTLALMDAGVPIKKPVAGIAMGLITQGGTDKFVTLSDIAGLEDHFGDMDFKVAGTKDGITALQMDIKISGVTPQILEKALAQAQEGRLFILGKMLETISAPRLTISQYAPRILSLQIDPEKIGMVIGSGGKTIRQIQTDFGVEVGVDDSGLVSVSGPDVTGVEKAIEYIKNMTAEAEIGKVYTGTVKRVQPFGAFVEFLPGQEGLVHVSNMGKGFVASPEEVVKEGQEVQVKVYEVDKQGRVNLTMDLENPNPTARPERRGGSSFQRGREGRPRREGGRGNDSRFTKFRDHR